MISQKVCSTELSNELSSVSEITNVKEGSIRRFVSACTSQIIDVVGNLYINGNFRKEERRRDNGSGRREISF